MGHLFDAITSPSLCTKQVNSSDVTGETGRNSLFIRVLLSLIKLLCQLFRLLPDQVKLKSFSHSWLQVSTHVKVRLYLPGPHSEVTAKTITRGNVLQWQKKSKCSRRASLFRHTGVLTLTIEGMQPDFVQHLLLTGGLWTLVVPGVQSTHFADDQWWVCVHMKCLCLASMGWHMICQCPSTHGPLHAATRTERGSVATSEWHWLTHCSKHFLYTIWGKGTTGYTLYIFTHICHLEKNPAKLITFYCCCIADGGFNRVILKQHAFPFPVMVCHFFSDDQLREACRGIFNAKSISTQRRVIIRTPLDLYPSAVTRAMSHKCIEVTLKLYCTIRRSRALSNWWKKKSCDCCDIVMSSFKNRSALPGQLTHV